MFSQPFKNMYRDHDFALISDTIKEFFPVDKPKRLTSKTVSSSRGWKKMGKIVNAEFLDEKAYRDKWGKLTSNLKKLFKKPVHGYPDLSGGGFIGEVIIVEEKKPDFIRQKSLRFYVSILGPFFSIHGVDSSVAILQIESRLEKLYKGNFAATHGITLSPVFEYQEVFEKLEAELRAFFPGYRFVPYEIGMSTMKNISIADEIRDIRSKDTIYEALFGRAAVHECLTRGDRRHGMTDWVKPLDKKEKSLLDLISQHIIDAPKDTTVHKVWKLQESRRLNSFTVPGNLTLAMKLFEVIDLSNKSTIIFISEKERGTPSSTTYKIIDNVIVFSETISFKIVDLTRDSLTLHLVIDLAQNNVSAKGAAVEMKFVQMKKI
jgi:hypothetical protein